MIRAIDRKLASRARNPSRSISPGSREKPHFADLLRDVQRLNFAHFKRGEWDQEPTGEKTK